MSASKNSPRATAPETIAQIRPDQKNDPVPAPTPSTAEHVALSTDVTANGNAIKIKQPKALDFVPVSFGDR